MTPRSKIYQARNSVEVDHANLPGSPGSKLSALIAKFNNPSSQSTPDRSPSRPPKKPLTTSLAEDHQKRIDTSKEGLMAPYTTNPPSPAKSQKSGKSDNTPQSMRSTFNTSIKLGTEELLVQIEEYSLRAKKERTHDVLGSLQRMWMWRRQNRHLLLRCIQVLSYADNLPVL